MNNNYFNTGGTAYNSGMYGPMSTNIIRVTSLDEAIMMTSKRPSEMVYFNQDRNEFYNVRVDYEGRKSWATFPYSLPNPDLNTPVSRADILALTDRVTALEAKIGGTVDAEPNG